MWFEHCKWWCGRWFYLLFEKGQPCEDGRQKLNSQLSILVDEDDALNPFISPSDEEDANKEMNVIKDETDDEIIVWICSFFNCLSYIKEKNYINNTSNL